MWFGILGPLTVATDQGESISLTAPRLRVLLAALLAEANHPVFVDALADLIWDGDPPAGAATTIRSYVLRLRRALGAAGGARIVTRNPGYLVHADEEEIDAAAFEARHRNVNAAIRTGDWRTVAAAATSALTLWRGTPLVDVPCPALLQRWTPHLEQLHLQVREWQIEAELALGHGEALIPQLRRLTVDHPLRERFHAQLMLALAGTDRRSEALAAYHNAYRTLADELGIEPGPQLQELHQRILAGDTEQPGERSTATSNRAVSGGDAVPGTRPVPHQLPYATSVFTGRRHEVAEVEKLVDGLGAVVISAIDGMAGVGKTALALHAAHRIAERFADGQLFIDLHGYTQDGPPRTAGEALEVFLRALGVPPKGIPDDVEERAALYRQRLNGTRTLIVLDNARDAGQVRPLVPGTPGCLVLVTSRRKLRSLDDAHTVTLDVLPPGDAVTLFRAVTGARHTAAGDEPATAIVEECGYLPLAVRIAAGLLRHRPAWTLADLAEQLHDRRRRLIALTDTERDLSAVFDLSHDSLNPAQQRLLWHLGLIPGPDIDRYAVAALLDSDPADAGRLLEELVDHNLLVEHAAGRYGLHDLLRGYAAELSHRHGPPADREAATRRLADWYAVTAHRAAQVVFPPIAAEQPLRIGSTRVRPPELGSRHAAFTWFEAHRDAIGTMIMTAAERGWDRCAHQLTVRFGGLCMGTAWWTGTIPVFETGLDAACRLADPVAEAVAQWLLGQALAFLGRRDAAVTRLRAALRLAEQVGDPHRGSMVLGLMATIMVEQGHLDEALDCGTAGLELARGAGRRDNEAILLNTIAMTMVEMHRGAEAVTYATEAVALFDDLGLLRSRAYPLDSLGQAYAKLGDRERAVACYRQALVAVRVGEPREVAVFQAEVGRRLNELGEIAEARQLWREALPHLAEAGEPLAAEVTALLSAPAAAAG